MKKLSLLDLEKRIRKLEKTVVLLKKHRRTQIRLDLDGEDSIDIVQKVTCEVWNVTLEQLLSKSRDAHLVNARISAAHLAYKDYSLGGTREIGDRFGGRDHSTISCEVQSADDLLESKDTAFCEPHYRAKSIMDVRFESIKNNGHPINYQI